MTYFIAALSLGQLLVEILIPITLIISILLILQSTHTLYLMIYTWDRKEVGSKTQIPARFLAPQLSFTVMLPARHEEDVIQTTIERVVRSHYPTSLLEVVVICSADDVGTIGQAQQKIAQLRNEGITNVKVAIFNDKPINKPHGLNVGLRSTYHEVVTIFDAEDDIHPDIFNVVNTLMLEEHIPVIQCGVQLMNYQSNWYSTLNVLEYFFWFKSRLHYHARQQATPLGGNSVFFTRELLQRVDGWDEHNLTEDADIGIRISCLGVPMRVVYDDRYVTREETPPTLGHFMRQRTRWSQGFLQTLLKGDWKRLPTKLQRILVFYTLAFPMAQAMLGIYVPAALVMMLTVRTPTGVTIILDLPFYLLIAHFCLAVIGLYEFTNAHGLKPSAKTPFVMALTYLPYQWVLSYAALRATIRHLRGINNWEKTQHIGAHRQELPALNPPFSVERRPEPKERVLP
jgi:cellulose synthase/poly-beta-1,6-N-acetylglucosamine synthase-like glycosyltransferase